MLQEPSSGARRRLYPPTHVSALELANVDPDAFFLSHFTHHRETHFAAVAAALVAAVGRHRADRAPAVDPDVSSFESLRRPHGAADVAGNHRRGETERTVVGERKRLPLFLERQHREHRPEDFFARDLHGVLHSVEDRRTDKESLLQTLRLLAAIDELGIALSAVDVAQDPLLLSRRDQRAHRRARIHLITELD